MTFVSVELIVPFTDREKNAVRDKTHCTICKIVGIISCKETTASNTTALSSLLAEETTVVTASTTLRRIWTFTAISLTKLSAMLPFNLLDFEVISDNKLVRDA